MAPRQRFVFDVRLVMTLLRDLELATAEILNEYLADHMDCQHLYMLCFDLFVSAVSFVRLSGLRWVVSQMVVFNPVLRVVRHRRDPAVTLFPLSAVLADWFLGDRSVGFGQLVWFDMAHGPSATPRADEALLFRGGEEVAPGDVPDYGELYSLLFG